MPELPEVETVAAALREGGRGAPSLVGRTVVKADVFWHKTVEKPSARTFKKRIVGQTVIDVRRRGKYIQISLTQDTMLVHLRMSGDLLVGEGEKPLGDHSRLVLYFKDGFQLSFNNPRKFGRVWLVKDPEEVFNGLGPEPFDPDLNPQAFHKRLSARKRLIKPLLLDQTFIAGVGNIYADEALNLAKIHPNRIASSLTPKQAKKLLEAIRAVLAEGIRRNGASIDWVYQGGDFQNHFRVYQRTGEACLECGTLIEKIVVGQRGTHFCPRCQPSPD
jgi:formamidopyrimidine-DNA glycosylase